MVYERVRCVWQVLMGFGLETELHVTVLLQTWGLVQLVSQPTNHLDFELEEQAWL
jgi:hypothetical protein